jgi:hypothetical protein
MDDVFLLESHGRDKLFGDIIGISYGYSVDISPAI